MGIRPDFGKRFAAVLARHIEVEQHQVGEVLAAFTQLAAIEEVHELLAVADGSHHLDPGHLFKGLGDEKAVIGIVVGDDDADSGAGFGHLDLSLSWRARGRRILNTAPWPGVPEALMVPP